MVFNTMRRAGAVLWLVLAAVQSISAVNIDPDTARAHAEAIRNNYPRLENSPGERQTVSYIREVLDTLNASYQITGFEDFEGGYSYSSSIDVQIPGNATDTLFIFVPIDHAEDRTPDMDGSASVAAALAFTEAALRENSPISYRVVFLGAESGDPATPLGTRNFLRRFFPETALGGIYLDANDAIPVVETGGGGETAPSWLVRAVADASRRAGMTPRVQSGINQLHRMGFSTERRALVDLLGAGVPTVAVSSVPDQFGPSPVAETAVSLANLIGSVADELRLGIPTEWDRHYLYVGVGRRQIVIPEYVYLPLLIATVFATLLYALVARRQLAKYLRTIGRNSWNLPVLFVLIFLFLSAGTLLLDLFLLVRRFPTLWESFPSSYVGLKLSLSVLLFSLAAQLLRHLPLSKNGSFYSAAAIFVLFTDVVLASILNVTLGSYFLWAYLFSFFFSIVPRRVPKLLLLMFAPIPMVVAAIQVLAIPELRFAETLLLSTRGNLLLSFVTLPFLLMLIRLDFLVRHPVAGRRSYALGIVTVVAAGFTAVLVVFIFIRPVFTEARPQPIEVVERIDYEAFTRDLDVRSPAPLGEFEIEFLGETEQVSTRAREWTRSVQRIPDVLSLRLSTVDFLDRNQARLTVDSPTPLDSVKILLSSESPMTIYDVDLPYRLSQDRLSASIFVGRRPPLPLEINYTTAIETAPRIEVVAGSSFHPNPILLGKKTAAIDSRLEIRTVLNP